jgi:hypothetical protein
MSSEVILTVILTLIPSLSLGGLIVAIFDHYAGKRKEIEQGQRERKEEQYKKFLENVIGFFSGWDDREKKKAFLQELYTHAPLYASAKVIRLANQFVASFNSQGSLDLSENGKSDQYYKELVVAIREDMGVWETDNLEEKDVKIFSLD